MTAGRRIAGVIAGAGAARLAYAALRRRPPGGPQRWARTNHHGGPVTLLEGPAYAAGAAAGIAVTPGIPRRVRIAGATAVLGAGALGAYDDVAGTGSSRGFAGHLGALRRGEVTSGSVKLLGIGVTGVTAATLLPGRAEGVGRLPDIVVDGAVIAASANLINLFDLRPGRAIKVGLLAGVSALAAGGHRGAVVAAPAGAAASLLRDDLGERAMLGDAGANALGAALGFAAVARPGHARRAGRVALLGGLAGLTAASEVISFTRVIAAVRPLRWVDELGRLPRAGATPQSGTAPQRSEPGVSAQPAGPAASPRRVDRSRLLAGDAPAT